MGRPSGRRVPRPRVVPLTLLGRHLRGKERGRVTVELAPSSPAAGFELSAGGTHTRPAATSQAHKVNILMTLSLFRFEFLISRCSRITCCLYLCLLRMTSAPWQVGVSLGSRGLLGWFISSRLCPLLPRALNRHHINHRSPYPFFSPLLPPSRPCPPPSCALSELLLPLPGLRARTRPRSSPDEPPRPPLPSESTSPTSSQTTCPG